MPKGIPNAKPEADAAPAIEMDSIGHTPAVAAKIEAAAAVKMVRVKLLKNYRPMEALDPTDPQKKRRLPPVFEIVGHLQPAVVVRNVLGKEEVLAPEKFIDDEAAPSPKAGVGFIEKLWAGTIVRVTAEEARYMRANGIGEIEIDD